MKRKHLKKLFQQKLFAVEGRRKDGSTFWAGIEDHPYMTTIRKKAKAYAADLNTFAAGKAGRFRAVPVQLKITKR